MKTKNFKIGLILGLSLTFTTLTFGQYNECAGQNKIVEKRKVEVIDDDTGETTIQVVEQEVAKDTYGNPDGNQYDLAVDGAFEGQTVAVLHLYTGEGFDFKLPKEAIEQKGFSVYRWINNPPTPEELEKALEKACQLWVISSSQRKLNDEHIAVIKSFFDSGKGVYIWGDNQPFYSDANAVSKALIDVEMNGNTMGNQTVDIQKGGKKIGLTPNHLITTGLQYIYEGITIATLDDHEDLTPIIYGSAGNLVTAVYEKDNKRLILDGGFTRLYINWDTAGTGRYVKNAAAWLVNYEFFGDEVVSN
ncbi:MAG: hypothetical protein COA32_16185 [Fluviicola sp.]|jgi:hypothetical protein|nr:MAG: hypothetical protein COA32_16185 [Fluviicola sp.]